MSRRKNKELTQVDLNHIVTTDVLAGCMNISHASFLRSARDILIQLDRDPVVFESAYLNTDGVHKPCLALPRLERDLVLFKLDLSIENATKLSLYMREIEEKAREVMLEASNREFKSDIKSLTKQTKDANKVAAIANQRKDMMQRSRDVARVRGDKYKTKAKNTRVLNKNQGESIVTKDKTIKESKKTITHLQEDASKLAYKLRNPEFEENVMHKGNKYVKECYSGRRKPTNEMNELMGQFDNVVYDMEEIVRKLGEELARNK